TDEARLLPRLPVRAAPVSGSGAQHPRSRLIKQRIGTRARVAGRAGASPNAPDSAGGGGNRRSLVVCEAGDASEPVPSPESRSAGGYGPHRRPTERGGRWVHSGGRE